MSPGGWCCGKAAAAIMGSRGVERGMIRPVRPKAIMIMGMITIIMIIDSFIRILQSNGLARLTE
jgi:hypothetical protein